MQFAPTPDVADARAQDSRTRDRVARAVLEHGPLTASDLACRLGLTSAAVRRHLDALAAAGLADVRPAATAPESSRGRGRPARAYVLTTAGHHAIATADASSASDDLAVEALAFVAEQLGPEAVHALAERRVAGLEERYAELVAAAGPDVAARTRALAAALSADGYAASTRSAGAAGTQLCQGHCPVQHVAARFPQLCEAETRLFSRLLGVHVQRLATQAGGAHVCTTHVPTGATGTTRTTSSSTTRTPDGRTRS